MGGLAGRTDTLQQVNLYRHRGATAASAGGTRRLLFAGVGALLLLVALGVGGEVYLYRLEAQRADVAAALHRQQAALAAMQQRIAEAAVDRFLEAELSRLREARARLQVNLGAIARHSARSRTGFSEFFAGLARNTLEGLWLDNVGLSAGGAEMRLKGQAVEPELVPRLLQALSAERAFLGRTFRKVSFERQPRDAGSTVEFELRSAPAQEVGDAG